MRVALGIPIVREVDGYAYASHLNLAISVGRQSDVVICAPVDVFPHDKARIAVWDTAREHNCDLLLFVDSDIVVPHKTFDLLLKTLRGTGAAMVAASCPRRGFPYNTTWFKHFPEGICPIEGAPEPIQIDSCGLPCNLIDMRKVEGNGEDLFRMGYIAEGAYQWEDGFFCQQLRRQDLKVYGDPNVEVAHLGERIRITRSNAEQLRRLHLLNTQQPQAETFR